MKVNVTCPHCFPKAVNITIEAWQSEDVTCPECGTICSCHGDDGYDYETNEENPYWWLEVIDTNLDPSPKV